MCPWRTPLSKRLFILGNGPSLLTQAGSLSHLDGDTFACNRFIHWNGHISPTYYACSANAVLKGVEPDNPPFQRERFMVSRRRDQLEGWDRWTPVYKKEWHDFLMPGASDLAVRGVVTMPGIMAQLAVWMGYDDLYFLGIEQRGSGHVFDPEGKQEMTYFIPDEEALFKNWRALKDVYTARGIHLTDCTPNGRLNEMLGYQPLEEVLVSTVA